ncbi:hypothetical protein OG889_40230 [Streptomyces sp. NBC_00481]|uniref:hypothetical protein n=1 Tax=unclassified Streptomyces TaxID=2593676 RepID=UPI002DD8F0B7|nr:MULTISPECIES: hypothetical protein [unclassified Streptomyces]WRZ00367.1 hypothetical protein OG889_40230 [Streptomyces sp. NBC_00481]
MKELFPRIGVLAGIAVGVSALLVPLTASPAAALRGLHVMAMASRSEINSIFISGNGSARWRSPAGSGTVEGNISACYMYRKQNTGDWVRQEGFQIYINQGGGKQGVGDEYQQAWPNFSDGTAMTITTFKSNDCTFDLRQQRRLAVPSDNLTYFWVDIR